MIVTCTKLVKITITALSHTYNRFLQSEISSVLILAAPDYIAKCKGPGLYTYQIVLAVASLYSKNITIQTLEPSRVHLNLVHSFMH